MKISLSKIVLMILCPVFVALAATVISVKQLEMVSSDLSGWIPQDDMRIYKGNELYDYNDGGAAQYLDKGVQTTGVQILDGQNGWLVQSMIMDFGKDSNAVAMFIEKQIQNAGQAINDPIYPDTVAFMTLPLGGVQGYCHYSNYYFEIAATGFNDQAQAISVFDTMFTWYIQRINELRNVYIKKVLTTSYKRESLKNVELAMPAFSGNQVHQGILLDGRSVRDSRKIAALPVFKRIRSQKKK